MRIDFNLGADIQVKIDDTDYVQIYDRLMGESALVEAKSHSDAMELASELVSVLRRYARYSIGFIDDRTSKCRTKAVSKS